MRRNTSLAVDTTAAADTTPDGSIYELTQSPSLKPKKSLESLESSLTAALPTLNGHSTASLNPSKSTYTPPTPSIRLLFSMVSQRDFVTLLAPAIISSIVSGGVAPFMTYVIGQAFDAFATFPLTKNPSQSAKDSLLHGIGIAALELVALAVGSLVLSSLVSALWISTGERNVMRLRKKVYTAVTKRDMEWFDTKMGAEDAVLTTEGEGPIGAGGLMAKFSRETDEVRTASSLAAGMLIQYLTTCITCLVLAFSRSWSLTLVILSAVPLFVIIQAISQAAAGPLLASERSLTATAATLVERALSAIATVKAFNAADFELESLASVLDNTAQSANKLHAVWGFTSSLSQFTTMAMFVQGFWFGSKLVRDGTISPGSVMSVFWACLIAMTNLQLCIPQLIIFTRGKWAMVSLMTLVEPAPSTPSADQLHSAAHSHITITPLPSAKRKTFPLPGKRHAATLRRIAPIRCSGDFTFSNVTFFYPSRPTIPVLNDVTLYLPANEMTFIVGGSGSGKSTVAQLLSRMYEPQFGSITLDDQDASFLDEAWMRKHVAVVSQNCILFDMTVHENVAMGLAGTGGPRRPEDVTRQEVIDACTTALMHEFVRDLPDGYETKLGTAGASLSGGQKQRLAIARAKLRDPTVLVLDEATSALDATSRLLVFEAIKQFRKNKTTIVITHDLSQISSQDFVYVLKNGSVIEQGYRQDLELHEQGELRHMMLAQGETGGFLPEKADPEPLKMMSEKEEEVDAILEQTEDDGLVTKRKHQSTNLLQSVSLGNWMFDVVADLTRSASISPAPPPSSFRAGHLAVATGGIVPADAFTTPKSSVLHRRQSFNLPPLPSPEPVYRAPRRRHSLNFTPTSPSFPRIVRPPSITIEDDDEFDMEKTAMERSGAQATLRRHDISEKRGRMSEFDRSVLDVKVEVPAEPAAPSEAAPAQESTSIFRLIRDVYPTLPQKPFVLFGMVICLFSGAMTPLFSFLLSRLMFEVSIGAQNVHNINSYGAIVLGIAAFDGLLIGLKFFVMETAAMNWVTSIRKTCYSIILAQDKKWFDKSENSPVKMVQVLIKDGDDARNLIAVVLGQFIVVATMLSVGLIWALVSGWQLTLAGFAIGPIFAITMAVQANFVGRAEHNNKIAREEIAKTYYESIANVRAIRSMSFESVFQQQFDLAVTNAHKTGIRGAYIEGCSFGVASALIYFAEALLFYVGAVLISRGIYTYLQMVEVLNLVIFSVTIGSQLMAFTQRIAKATEATRDFNKLLALTTDTDESKGSIHPTITGDVAFENVHFSYPERAEVPVLKGMNFQLFEDECVAIVGSSGSGKSTVTALLQRLYEPASGLIKIGGTEIGITDVKHLREHVSVVSQNPHLFDTTISENISYGSKGMSQEAIQQAAKAAHVHDFIMSLPKGYDTTVGENASLISGGQAQRLQIARALARPSNLLILDECTSALDPENQAAVMDTIRSAKIGRTTLIVTHKLPMMQLCDRIIVVQDGVVVEEGPFESLMKQGSVFAHLAGGGEWSNE